MENPQEDSASFERLKGILDDSGGGTLPQNEPLGTTLARRRQIAAEDTQIVQDVTDEEESDDAIAQGKPRASSPATSLLLGEGTEYAATQSSPAHKPQIPTIGDSQLPNTQQTETNTGVDRTHHTIHLDYSPEKLTGQIDDNEETQKDPDSYNDRMRENVASITEMADSRALEENMDSERLFDSPSQHPIYFDERKRFSVGPSLLPKLPEGFDDDEEDVVVRMSKVQENPMPLGLTQIFEASSPQRPVTNSSMLPTSPRLGFTSPVMPKEPPTPQTKETPIQPPVGLSNHYVSVEESQEARERRRKKLSFPEDIDDPEFGAAPPDLVARLRGQRREKDSVEYFKEMSIERPKPPQQTKGRRGRPPKNRLESLLPPSVPEIDEESSPILENSELAADVAIAVGDSVDEDDGEFELEVPGTMEAAVTEVKKTQSSQYLSGVPKNTGGDNQIISSQVDVIADSQPDTTAKTKGDAQDTVDVAQPVREIVGSSSSINPHYKRQRNRNKILDSSSPGKFSAQGDNRIPSSSPPMHRTRRKEQHIVESSPQPESSHGEGQSIVEVDETPRLPKTRNTAVRAKNLSFNPMKTPMTAKKIPALIPNTIPATSPYNRDHLLSIDTPVPQARRKRKLPEEIPSSVDLVPTGETLNLDKAGSEIGTPTKGPPAPTEIDETPFPRSKRLKSDRNLRQTGSTEVVTKPSTRNRRRNSTMDGEPLYKETNSASPTDMDITPTPERPSLTLDTTTPQKATIPFRPTESEKKELDTVSPLRVFAQWDQSYYPATIYEFRKYQESTPARFVGAEISVRLDRMKRLELRAGDAVKLHGQGAKVWIVQQVYKLASTSNTQKSESQTERDEVLDVYGNNMVKVKHKTSEKILEKHIGDVILTAAQFYQLKSDTIAAEQSMTSAEETPSMSMRRDDSLLDTPSKFSRRSTPSISNVQQLKSLKLSSSVKSKPGIFSGMRFSISLPGQNEDRGKSTLVSMLQRHGASILEAGFEDLFEPLDDDSTELVPRPGSDLIGFTAVISDRYSTTVKYCQALALGLPCLAMKWVEDSIQNGNALPWEDYLLPAGESQYLDGAVKSRVIDWVDIRSATFMALFSKRRKLMEGLNVIFFDDRGKRKSDPQPYTFLIHAIGPACVHYTKSVDAVNDLLKSKNSKVKWHLVFSKDGSAGFSAKRKGRDTAPVRFVSDEWLKQSLIIGKILQEDF